MICKAEMLTFDAGILNRMSSEKAPSLGTVQDDYTFGTLQTSMHKYIITTYYHKKSRNTFQELLIIIMHIIFINIYKSEKKQRG